MIAFAWPWLFSVLPLPLLVRLFTAPLEHGRQAALRVPVLDDFALTSGRRQQGAGRRWQLWIALIAWSLLVVATTRPQWLGEPIPLPLDARDLMLAVDLSGSMKERDFIIDQQYIDRLTVTKRVAGDFISRRVGDRIGLILFGEQAYLQTPLTFDRETVRRLLQESAIGLAGGSTAIGDAIGLAIKKLRDKKVESRVLILLTDGANTGGVIQPEKAADLARQIGLKIYTIGIGADRLTMQTLFGSQVINPSRDLNEAALKRIAGTTGGRYFRARNTEELTDIYALLDELEPVAQEAQLYRPVRELYPWPLAAALLLATAVIAAPLLRRADP
ncbi:MAG: VWA domain-containing protein [Gammaproteobacteria bacterium]|nr:VWA domain-containing protein [Gammaproteobacteria bacterium]